MSTGVRLACCKFSYVVSTCLVPQCAQVSDIVRTSTSTEDAVLYDGHSPNNTVASSYLDDGSPSRSSNMSSHLLDSRVWVQVLCVWQISGVWVQDTSPARVCKNRFQVCEYKSRVCMSPVCLERSRLKNSDYSTHIMRKLFLKLVMPDMES